jgi:alpha-L-arabinofuranosidase
MKLYRDHSKPVPLRTLQESPEGLDISACAAEDGKALCIFIVNSRKEPMSLSLDLEDFGRGFVPGSGEVICDTQDRSQIDVINFWDHPDRIKTLPLSIVGSKIVLPALSISVIECGQ